MARRSRSSSSTKTAPPELKWSYQGVRLRTAAVPGGSYVLISDGLAQWTAQWRPRVGRVGYLVMRATEQLARQACEQHQLEQLTDKLLTEAGNEDLARADLAGAATTWKGPRRHP